MRGVQMCRVESRARALVGLMDGEVVGNGCVVVDPADVFWSVMDDRYPYLASSLYGEDVSAFEFGDGSVVVFKTVEGLTGNGHVVCRAVEGSEAWELSNETAKEFVREGQMVKRYDGQIDASFGLMARQKKALRDRRMDDWAYCEDVREAVDLLVGDVRRLQSWVEGLSADVGQEDVLSLHNLVDDVRAAVDRLGKVVKGSRKRRLFGCILGMVGGLTKRQQRSFIRGRLLWS